MGQILPNVQIDYGNGAIGQAISSADGLLCLVVTGATAVGTTFELNKLYNVRRFTEVKEKLGITDTNNPEIYKIAEDFYAEAQEGTRLYIIGYAGTVTLADALNKDKAYARKVLEETNGEIRGLIVSKKAKATPTITKGLDSEISLALTNAQALGDWAAQIKFAPIFTLIDGVSFNGKSEDLEDFKGAKYNRVGIVIGSTASQSANQAIGLVAGRIASSPVQRNIGRVQDGSLNASGEMYIGNQLVQNADIDMLFQKKYITFRTFTGISGYFIADDPLATSETDDYGQLARRRVIDKAYRIAYSVLVRNLLDEVPVNRDGSIIETYAAAFEYSVISAIATNMTANGELSVDPSNSSDKGVECIVDRSRNILADSIIEADLLIRPHGYGKYINVKLGFPSTTTA